MLAADTTPPTAPTISSATAQQLSGVSATWDGAADPESAISYYIFGIGTNPSGDYSTLANTRWWQVTYDKSVSVAVTLNAATTYYFSVYAVNAAGLSSPFATSGPIRPAFVPLGQQGNTLQIAFATTGYDASGNPTAGWQASQVTALSSFFNKMYPLLLQIYGPPADSYTVTVVRDLRYSSSNIFLPASDEIRMDDGFFPQLFTHELLHAFRNDHILSSNQNWTFDPTLSGFEESFAQAVSYDAMNRYVQAYPTDSQVPGNSLWGSSNDWDYDFQNMTELRGTDFWSEGGATGLHWLKYEMGAAAIRKINIESADFYRRFNQEYYARINANPATVRVSRSDRRCHPHPRPADRGRRRGNVDRQAAHLLRAERLRGEDLPPHSGLSGVRALRLPRPLLPEHDVLRQRMGVLGRLTMGVLPIERIAGHRPSDR